MGALQIAEQDESGSTERCWHARCFTKPTHCKIRIIGLGKLSSRDREIVKGLLKGLDVFTQINQEAKWCAWSRFAALVAYHHHNRGSPLLGSSLLPLLPQITAFICSSEPSHKQYQHDDRFAVNTLTNSSLFDTFLRTNPINLGVVSRDCLPDARCASAKSIQKVNTVPTEPASDMKPKSGPSMPVPSCTSVSGLDCVPKISRTTQTPVSIAPDTRPAPGLKKKSENTNETMPCKRQRRS